MTTPAVGLVVAACALLAVGCKDPPPGFEPACGDGVLSPGELCDDGNLAIDDDCLPDCSPATCGDGIIRAHPLNPADREECDSGGVDTCGCDADCSFAVCGDRHVNRDAGEVCDDGNTRSADGCRADCRSDETCGNGIVDSHLPKNGHTHPEECLEGTVQGTGCAEVCDDGNRVSGDGCSANCLSDETCGNGIRDPLGNGADNPPEACDDGNQVNGDLCPSGCQADGDGGLCGDGIVGPNQDCDDGPVETALCDYVPVPPFPGFPDPQSCTFALCGDGHRNAAAGEECDDGNARLDDDCVACRLAVCGDGATDREPPAVEDCDLGAQNGQPGAPCSATCTFLP